MDEQTNFVHEDTSRRLKHDAYTILHSKISQCRTLGNDILTFAGIRHTCITPPPKQAEGHNPLADFISEDVWIVNSE